MVEPSEIERALRAALPAHLHTHAPALARLLADAAAHPSAPAPADPALAPVLAALAGQELRTANALVSFGEGSQLGDVRIGDVAGGDIIQLSLTLPAVQNLAQGRNIIQIGRLVLPARLLLLLVALLLLAAAAAAWALRGPSTMAVGTGTFNIAVADFARDEAGMLRADPEASRLSRQVFDTLRQQQAIYSTENPADLIVIWHDSMGWSQKGVTIGFVEGAAVAERELAAQQRLAELKAQVLIYGYLDDAGQVALSFYVSPELKTESGPGALAGTYQLGEPQRPAGVNLTTRAGALFWLLKGLQYDSRGEPGRSRDVLRRGEELLPDWGELGEGKEILYFFQGQAATFAAASAPDAATFAEQLGYAEQRFARARAARPDFLRAAIGQGAVAFQRSQCLLGAAPCAPLPATAAARSAALAQALAQADQALASYEQAVALAPGSPDRIWAAGVAPMAVGSAYLLRGEIAWQQLDTLAADAAYAEATRRLGGGLAAAEGDRRILGQTYLMLGTALWRRGMLAAARPAAAAPLLRDARAAFASCVAQADSGDKLLDQMIANCRTRDQQVAALLAPLEVKP